MNNSREKLLFPSCFVVLILHFIVVCLVAKPLNRSEATGDLVVKPCFFSYVNHSVIMLTSFASLSFQGHLQPHFHTKAWLHFTQL